MGKARTVKDLWIWQQARVFVCDIYGDFGRGQSGYRDYGFKDQIQPADVSIMNKIAEGFGCSSETAFARFWDIAKSLRGEV